MKKGLIIILAFTLLFSILSFIVSAQPPFTEQTGGGLNIEFSKIDIIKQNQNHHFHFHVFNATNFISNETATCGFTLTIPNGTFSYKNANIPYHTGSENEWGITLDGNNFTTIGEYSYVVECNTTTEIGFTSVPLEVTPSGFSSETSDAILYTLFTVIIFAIFLLMLYFIIVLPGGNPTGMENEVTGVNNMKYLRIVLIALSYPMLILILNFLNGLAVNFVTLTIFANILGFMFLVMLKLSWIWTLIMIIWVFYWVVKDSNFKKLMRSIGNPLPGV